MLQNRIAPHFSTTLGVFCHLETKWNESIKSRPLLLLAGAVSIAALPILLIYDLGRSLYRSYYLGIPRNDYHYFYSSKIFASYQEQLGKFIDAQIVITPSIASLDLIRWIKKPMADRAAHFEGVILRLRELVKNKGTLPPETASFVDRFCRWVYTGPKILDPMSEWLSGQIDQTHLSHQAGSKNGRLIEKLHTHLGSQPRFQGEVFQDFLPYDPRMLGDAPSHFFQMGETQVIRTPAVTRDGERTLLGKLNSAEIVEEFKGFLESYEKLGKRHLYVNLMANHGSENVRNEALRELERTGPDALDLIHLSKDSFFYHQWGTFSSVSNASEFKKLFLDQLFGGSDDYRWPLKWDLNQTRLIGEEAIDEIHSSYFGSRAILSRDERCDFIELAYTRIIEKAAEAHKPASCNVSCRSCIDRGAANLSLLYAKTQPVKRETLAAIALVPAILAQNRVMIRGRMDRLVTALDRIS